MVGFFSWVPVYDSASGHILAKKGVEGGTSSGVVFPLGSAAVTGKSTTGRTVYSRALLVSGPATIGRLCSHLDCFFAPQEMRIIMIYTGWL